MNNENGNGYGLKNGKKKWEVMKWQNLHNGIKWNEMEWNEIKWNERNKRNFVMKRNDETKYRIEMNFRK